MPSVLSRPEEPIEKFEDRSASEYEDDEEEVEVRITEPVDMDAADDDDEVPAEDMDDIDAESAYDMDEFGDDDDEGLEDDDVFDAPMSSEEILSSVLATPEGDTVCSALVNVAHQLEITNKILIKMLKHMTQE